MLRKVVILKCYLQTCVEEEQDSECDTTDLRFINTNVEISDAASTTTQRSSHHPLDATNSSIDFIPKENNAKTHPLDAMNSSIDSIQKQLMQKHILSML